MTKHKYLKEKLRRIQLTTDDWEAGRINAAAAMQRIFVIINEDKMALKRIAEFRNRMNSPTEAGL
jgi:hypothetical protein